MTLIDKLAEDTASAGLPTQTDQSRLNEMPIGTGKGTLEGLLSLTQPQALELWGKLPSPTLDEMNGHYAGFIPDPQGRGSLMFDEASPVGYWLGKAFRPLDDNLGEGYNRWRYPGGRVERNLRMTTRIEDSIIDGKPCFVLDYNAVYSGMTLYDELRKVDDGVFLGTATYELPDGTRTSPHVFALIGPTDEWVGGPYSTDDEAHQHIF
ncbi:hypothetical protein ACIQTZ_12555 [Paenarthrobacter sp. NPDC090520]|uniref:hypothetical protein n=1 Tax=Paenarthrobacter sp. NPDC090520 TaxID=3364382 RepID=UPI00382D0B92